MKSEDLSKRANPKAKKITLFVSLITLTYLLISTKFEPSAGKMLIQVSHTQSLK